MFSLLLKELLLHPKTSFRGSHHISNKRDIFESISGISAQIALVYCQKHTAESFVLNETGDGSLFV